MMKRSLWLLILLLGLGLVAAGCSDDDDGGQQPTPVDQFEVVRTAVDGYLTDLGATTPIVNGSAVYDANFVTGDTADDYFLLSVRSATHYAIGHATGAVNRSWRTVGDAAWQTATLPQDGSKIAVYCYTGHTGQVATTALGVMGYDVVNIKHGMYAWNNQYESVTGYSDTPPIKPYEGAEEYAFETAVNDPAETYELPDRDWTTSTNEAEILSAAMNAWLTSGSPTINASDVFANLNDGDANNDYFIISVRSGTHYALGHVPGAINIPWKEIATAENLARIPTDKTIVVYCYTGHTGQIATTILGILGYDVRNMKFGFYAWNSDPDATGFNSGFLPYDHEADYEYPIEGTYND